MSTASAAQTVLAHTTDVADFPKPGIQFKDLSPLYADHEAFRAVIADVVQRRRGSVDLVCGIEARGFVVGAPVALGLEAGFVPVRKAGKLPGPTLAETYELEYGTATIEVHPEPFTDGPRVLLIDDVLATGGTARAAAALLRRAGAQVVGFEALLELTALDGRARLDGLPTHAVAGV